MYELAIKDKKLRLKVGEWFDIDGEKIKMASGVNKRSGASCI